MPTWIPPHCAARLLTGALLLSRAAAGVGGSVVSLSACAPSSAVMQTWALTGGKLELQGDANPLWGSTWCLSTGFGIGTLTPAPSSTLFTSPCGSALAVTLTTPASRSSIAVASGPGVGLCVTVPAPGALPGVQLTLEPCEGGAAPPDAQAFSYDAVGRALTHAASGLCVDAGTRAKACEAGSRGAGLPFCDAAAPVDARVADLVGRLSFAEKVAMLATPSGGAPGVGVLPSQFWQEALHGLANNLGTTFDDPTPASTAFPQPITSSASFNRTLWLETGRAISDEVRAFANVGHSGLTMWSPNINIARDPRWGRIQETPGCVSACGGGARALFTLAAFLLTFLTHTAFQPSLSNPPLPLPQRGSIPLWRVR